MLYRFTLTYSGADTVVEEPDGWTEFKSEIKRDFKSHGVIFKFTSGTLKLGFADGRDILETAFRNDGLDAVVTLKVEQRPDAISSWETIYTGNAVMENREYNVDYFMVDFETSTFNQKVINRMNTKVRLDSTIDLDGNPLTGSITSYTGSWNDIRLKVKYRADFREGGLSTSTDSYSKTHITTNGTPVYSYFIVDFTGPIEEELKSHQIAGEIQNTGQLANNSGRQNFVISSENPGDITITGTFKYRYHGTFTTNSVNPINIHLRWYLRHENSAGTLQSQTQCFIKTITTDATSPYAYDSGVLTESFTETTITDITEGDRVFLYMETEAAVTEGGSITSTNAANIDVYHNTRANFAMLLEADTNSVKHYLTHDIIEWVVYILTGDSTGIFSNLFGLTDHGYIEDGCAGLTAITNGSHLRGINDAIEISLKDILDALSAMYGTGYGFESDGAGNYFLRIELMEHFYQNDEILDLGTPVPHEEGSYVETVFNDLVFNKVNIGYSKYANDEDFNGDIDDFLTESEYSLPLSTVTGNYTKISKLITSGRLIQATYQAKEDLDKSWKYDNDNFFISVVRSASTFIPENDENFESLSGFDNSAQDTAYNIRLAPVYMMINHALIVNSTLLGKSISSIIINTSTEVNKNFQATFNNYELCLLADQQRLQRTSVGNITIEENYEALRLFEPIQHKLTVAMTKTQLDTIIDSMEGVTGGVVHGYLTYRDNEGNTQQGFPLNIIWNPNDEIAEIVTLERADTYNNFGNSVNRWTPGEGV